MLRAGAMNLLRAASARTAGRRHALAVSGAAPQGCGALRWGASTPAHNRPLPPRSPRRHVRTAATAGSGGSGPRPPVPPSGGGGGGAGAGGGSGHQGGGGALATLWGAYLAHLGTSPILTKSVTAAVINGLGDMLCQVVFEGKSVTRGTFDSWRLFKFTLLGGALVGPVLHNWYLTLANIVKVPGTAGVVARLVLDQGVFAPFFISTFIACLMAMDGDLANVPAKLRQDLGETVVTNWKIWLPFQFLNFRFVPQQFQVLAANVVALVWNVCLSFISNRAVEDPAAAGAKKA